MITAACRINELTDSSILLIKSHIVLCNLKRKPSCKVVLNHIKTYINLLFYLFLPHIEVRHDTLTPLKPSGYFIYHKLQQQKKSTFCPHSVSMCFVWISEQTAIISLYNINWLLCITQAECVYCAVRTGYLNAVCPTCYRTRHFFNNSNTNEDIATKFEQEYVRCVRNEKECVRSVCL